MPDVAIRFGRPAHSLWSLRDAEFLETIKWRSGTRAKIVQAARNGDTAAVCHELFRAALRARPRGTADELRSSLWSRHAFSETERTRALVEIRQQIPVDAARSRVRRAVSGLREWLDAAGPERSVAPFDLLVLLEILQRAAEALPEDLRWTVWRVALTGAVELSTQLDEPTGSQATQDQRLLIQGELPWEIGLMFPEVEGVDRLRRRGRQTLRKQLLEHTDTDGTPRAELLERLAFWLAPFTRAVQWAEWAGVDLWDERSARRFRALVKMASPLCGPDGRLALSNGFIEDRVPLLSAALRHGGWKPKQLPLESLRAIAAGGPRRSRRPAADRHLRKAEFLPVMQSDWARVGCLRSDWSAGADRLVVAHHERLPLIELTALGQPLLSGAWDLEISVGGEPLEMAGEWSCVCWNSDEDADYLELQTMLDGLRIERQLLLSRTDHFAVLADSIAGAGGERIDYRARLPLVGGVGADPATATRECRLIHAKSWESSPLAPRVDISTRGASRPHLPSGRAARPLARCFPLALPEDRVRSTAGALEPVAGGLELRQAALGGLYAPLVIDWHPARRRGEAQWRTLTVSEDGRILKSDSASGHRLRIGTYHLLIYRALMRGEGHRAVLGHHTLHETVIGRFDAAGNVTPILLVE